MNTVPYHLTELEIASHPDDPRRLLPELPREFTSILDVGCGVGQTLLSLNCPAEVLVCGVDVDDGALRTGHGLTDRILFTKARGEQLPFATGAFDVVISRVALPYMNIPIALREIARVTKRGGHLWLALHPFAFTRKWLLHAARTGNIKSTLTQTYSLINGLGFHLVGRQFRFPLKRTHCESFQTIGAMRRALRANGFALLRAESKGETMSLTATRAD